MKFLDRNGKFEILDDKVKILITKRNFNHSLSFFSVKQTHSNKFYFVSNNQIKNNNLIEADAIITNLTNFPIAIKTADCLSIFIYSKLDKIIAVVHAGWRGTSKKILKNVVDFLINELNLSLSNLTFLLGPCICEKCYIVKNDMKSSFIKNFGKLGEKFFKKINTKEFLFDLKKANIKILKNFDINDNQIFNLNKCTVCNNNEFYSFRKEKTNKRILNIIELMED